LSLNFTFLPISLSISPASFESDKKAGLTPLREDIDSNSPAPFESDKKAGLTPLREDIDITPESRTSGSDIPLWKKRHFAGGLLPGERLF